ncbi:hypothetical protein TYRP_021744, partial [Tyrophagus putrescentiae]
AFDRPLEYTVAPADHDSADVSIRIVLQLDDLYDGPREAVLFETFFSGNEDLFTEARLSCRIGSHHGLDELPGAENVIVLGQVAAGVSFSSVAQLAVLLPDQVPHQLVWGQ